MLLLLFQTDSERFGLDVADVVEVLPPPALRKPPHAPEWLAGVFVYRGEAIPVIDLSRLLAGRAARAILSTRLILVRRPAAGGASGLVGLLAEQVVETVSCSAGQLRPASLRLNDAPYLGDVLPVESGFIQTLRVDRLPLEAE